MKAKTALEVRRFEHIPNVGPAFVRDLEVLGISDPAELATQDPLALYESLSARTGVRQDPCVLDVFMAAVDFMNGAPARPWWHYTTERKRRYPVL